MDKFETENRMHELRSLIASDWTGIEEKKRMYLEIHRLEETLHLKETEDANLRAGKPG